MLNEVSLFASGTVKEEDSAFVSDRMHHVGFLPRNCDLRIVMQVAMASCKQTFSLVSCPIHDDNCLSVINWWGQSSAKFLLPFP